jgi:hypothetical protein
MRTESTMKEAEKPKISIPWVKNRLSSKEKVFLASSSEGNYKPLCNCTAIWLRLWVLWYGEIRLVCHLGGVFFCKMHRCYIFRSKELVRFIYLLARNKHLNMYIVVRRSCACGFSSVNYSIISLTQLFT